MTHNQDARPFVDLQKDAKEFQAKFDEDIEKCKSILDAKITALICDPDSLGNSVGPKQNALVEFSKAKYDIYISMKSLMNDMEREWLKYISAMKKLFIENVEVFLANTKLEVTLPSGYQPSPGPKKSPGIKKPSVVTSSIYPIISTITKNIPVFSQKNKSLDFEMLTDEAEMDLNTSQSSSRSRKSGKLDNSSVDLNKSWSFSRQKSELNERVDLESSLVLSAENGISDDEDTDEKNPASNHFSAKGQKNQSPGQNLKRNSLQGITQQLSPRYGRKSVFPAQNGISPKHASSSESQEETRELESGLPHISSRKSVRSSARSKSAAITKENSTTSDENKVFNQTETCNNSVVLKGRRGRQAPKSKANAKTLEQNEKISEAVPEELVIAKKSNTTSDESDDINQTETSNSKVSVKGRRGRQAPKSKTNAKTLEQDVKISEAVHEELAVTEKNNTTSDESEDINQTETSNSNVSVKGRRGRQAPKSKANAKTLEQDEKISEAVPEELDVTSVTSKTRKGRPAVTKNVKSMTGVTSVTSGTHKGKSAAARSAVNLSDTSTEMTGRSTRRKTINERVSEKEPSVSSITVTFSAKHDDDDSLVAGPSKCVSRRKTLLPNLEKDVSGMHTPVAGSSKCVSRRKTLLPNLEEDVSDHDIIPGNRVTARSKRKTISGVTDLASVAPSKRLKSSNTQKNYTSIEDEGADDDNLLETNDGYSEWIALKSIDGKIPTSPAVYEVKVWRAKKTAYIGSCDSLRQKLTLHKLRQNSGHKHLDKFIERNYDDIQIRYEVVSSVEEAKTEVKNRVNSFVSQHKTTPAYN